MVFPCKKDCPLRSAMCHCTCKQYLEAKEVHDKRAEEIRKKKQEEFALQKSYRRAAKAKYERWKRNNK